MYSRQSSLVSIVAVALSTISCVNSIPLDPNSSGTSLTNSGGGMPAEPGYVNPWLFKELGGTPTPFGCQGIIDNCLDSTGTAANGAPWTITSSKNGNYLFLKNDATVLDCLINLHFTQQDRCISVEGSQCQALVTTSRIQNTKTIDPADGAWEEARKIVQLTASQSTAMQSAAEAMINSNVSSSSADAPNSQGGFVGIASGNPGAEDAFMWVSFIGQDQC